MKVIKSIHVYCTYLSRAKKKDCLWYLSHCVNLNIEDQLMITEVILIQHSNE